MLDIGWSELMVIGVLALIVVGPNELPRLMRTVGQYVGRARRIAREFQRSMEDAAREADLKDLTDLKRDLERTGRVDYSVGPRKSAESLVTGGPRPAAGKPPAESEPAPAAPADAAEKAAEPAAGKR